MPGEYVGTAQDVAAAGNGGTSAPTVREATFDVLRTLGLTTIFSNPGSTEVSFLAGLPDDLEFVLGLHEGSVVGMATGFALGRGAPAFALLHTTAGLGNAVSALATARVNRAPLVVMVGQQDRRHLAQEPFLAGPPARPGGRVPGVGRPARARAGRPGRARPRLPRRRDRARPRARDRADGRLARARARGPRGRRPRAPAARRRGGPRGDRRARRAARRRAPPALVVGAGADTQEGWAALVALAEHLSLPRVDRGLRRPRGLPAGPPALRRPPLPRPRPSARDARPHDAILAVGAPIFRQYAYEPGPLVNPGTTSRSSPTTPPRRTAARRR